MHWCLQCMVITMKHEKNVVVKKNIFIIFSVFVVSLNECY